MHGNYKFRYPANPDKVRAHFSDLPSLKRLLKAHKEALPNLPVEKMTVYWNVEEDDVGGEVEKYIREECPDLKRLSYKYVKLKSAAEDDCLVVKIEKKRII